MICPRCNMNTCQAFQENYVIPPKTKQQISLNLNPFKPFTILNHKEKVVRHEININRVKWFCSNCGYTSYNDPSGNKYSTNENEWTRPLRAWEVIFILFAIIAFFVGTGKHIASNSNDKEQSTKNKTTIATTTEDVTTPFLDELSIDEYKALCESYYYDDIFFGDNNLEDKYVKLELMLSEREFFTENVFYSDNYMTLNNKCNFKRDYYKCCVLRKDTNSYVGHQVVMLFSENYSLSPNDYKVGQKIIVYAKVAHWSGNTSSGYNNVIILPKYIEVK